MELDHGISLIKRILGIPGESPEPLGTSGDPWPPRGRPWDPRQPPQTTKRTHISANSKRQKRSIAASESFRGNASFQGLAWTACTLRERRPFWWGGWNADQFLPQSSGPRSYIYIYIHIYIYILCGRQHTTIYDI